MTRCPPWDQDSSSSNLAALEAIVKRVYSPIQKSAARSLLTNHALGQWHYTIFCTLVPKDYYAGNFRQDDRSRPCLGQNVKVGNVLGEDYRRVVMAMRELQELARKRVANYELKWPTMTKQERALELSLVMAWMIGSFIRIHPFINGNGRISRLIWAWALLRLNVPVQCRVMPRPDPPYPNIMSACMHGDDSHLTLFILQHLGHYAPAIR